MGEKAFKSAKTEWRDVVLVCRKCSKPLDGGFGPGFTGLNPVQLIGAGCEDHRRRGPDYCGTIPYPESFIPLATQRLDYHYDLDTGRIISSNAHWEDQGLEPNDIYVVAFQSLAAMMEDCLSQS